MTDPQPPAPTPPVPPPQPDTPPTPRNTPQSFDAQQFMADLDTKLNASFERFLSGLKEAVPAPTPPAPPKDEPPKDGPKDEPPKNNPPPPDDKGKAKDGKDGASDPPTPGRWSWDGGKGWFRG